MNLFSIVKQQRKRWTKSENKVKNIDLPNGVTLKTQKKKHRKIFPKFFSSIFKSKYNAAVEATNQNKINIIQKSNSTLHSTSSEKINSKPSPTARLLLQAFNSDTTLHRDDLYDSEKTVQANNITYIKYPRIDINEYESTVGTVVSEEECKSPTQAFLTRKTIHLKGRYDCTYPVLSEYLAEIIRSRLPTLLQEATTWKLLYSMDQHGARLSTLYRMIKDQGPCVIVLKNSENEVFGAFVSEPFDTENHGFFGTPECFLWKANKYQFKKFSATHKNQYFMLAEPSFIAMGGGNGNFGFYLDEDIQFGYSSTCKTFDNETLTEDNEFECFGCEIWGLEF